MADNANVDIDGWENVHAIVDSQIRADGFHEWPFSPSFPVDVRAFAFGSHRNVRLTRHDYCELLFVCSGEATYEVQDKSFLLRNSDLMVVSDSLYHRLGEVITPPFKALVLYFMPDVLRPDEMTGEHELYLSSFLLQREGFRHVIASETGVPRQVRRLILEIRRLLPANSSQARLVVRTYLEMILVLLMNHDKEQITLAGPLDRNYKNLERMRPLFDFIEENYARPIELATASSIVGMSKPHFMRSFKRATGQSFDTYLNRYRIAKAQGLLAKTDLPISAVGQEVGFADQSYFGLVFRRLVKISPREYRYSLQPR
jgi:AraC-like DNA-binding protein/mannose-6-phosphate isomerase-like protein (cupin superfamily)